MRGARDHHRDSLEFVIHDLKHAEHFCESEELYKEQVGFFRCLASLGKEEYARDSPCISNDNLQHCLRTFFIDALGVDDLQAWLEIEYVASGMLMPYH